MRLKTKNLIFCINENGKDACFVLPQKPEKAAKGMDFWRLILDDGLRTEIPVRSSRQTGSVTETERGLSIVYDHLLSDYGDYLLRGKFTVIDPSKLPDCVKRGEHISEDGGRILRILYNISDDPIQVGDVSLKGDEIRFDVFDADEYRMIRSK